MPAIKTMKSVVERMKNLSNFIVSVSHMLVILLNFRNLNTVSEFSFSSVAKEKSIKVDKLFMITKDN